MSEQYDEENSRLAALIDLAILDTPEEACFNEIAEIAASSCGVSIALVTLVDTDRQWFKANKGLEAILETPREGNFCSHAIKQNGIFEVNDASQDPRFANNPLVTNSPNIRFYAGATLRLTNGANVGTLCVFDTKPKKLSVDQHRILKFLSSNVVRILERRRAIAHHAESEARFRALSAAASFEISSTTTYANEFTLTPDGEVTDHVGSMEDITVQRQRKEALRKSELLLADIGLVADVGGWELDISTQTLNWSDQTFRIHELTPGIQLTLEEALSYYTEDSRPIILDAISRATSEGIGWDLELPMVTSEGKQILVRSVVRVEFTRGRPVRLIGSFQNITHRALQHQALERAHQRISIATESGDIGVWDWEIQTDNLTWTPQMFSLYGLARNTSPITYALWVDRLHPEDRASTEQELKNSIQNGAEFFNSEFRIVWPDGSIHHIKATAKISRDSHGKAIQVLGVNWDVTPLRQLTDELARQHELLQVTLQSIGDAVITADTHGCVTWLNPIAEHMTGWSAKNAIGEPISTVFNIIHESSRRQTVECVSHCMDPDEATQSDLGTVLLSRSGLEFGIEDSAAPIRSKDGSLLGVVLVFRDVSGQRKLANEMQHRAMHDTLTGLVNRSEFENRLQRLLTIAKNGDSSHALLYVDLDQFKLVNDSCGHSQGDQLLIQVANLMKDIVRSEDTVARIGGDEFALILKNCDADLALKIAQSICDFMIDFRFFHKGRKFIIGTSIGLVNLDNRWNTIEDAMQAADISCYAAKEEGRNRVHVWCDTKAALQEHREGTNWAARIEQALDEDLFELYAQRICPVGAESDNNNAEILLRIRDKDGSLLYPNSFITAAERFHLATRIDRWVLNKTIDTLRHLSDESDVNTLFINLSGQSVGDREFHAGTIQLLKTAGSDICQKLCLEITETAAITNISNASAFVDNVRALGVKVALDDFGAGASSFGYLKTLKVDLLKIDGQFIEGVVDDPLDSAAVRCFVDVANVMGIETIAEYVSSADIMKCVTDIGVDYAQGFHLHRPEPIEKTLKAFSKPKPIPMPLEVASL